MQTENTNTQSELLPQEVNLSVCNSLEEEHKLLKFFEILIDIDKSLKSKSNENYK